MRLKTHRNVYASDLGVSYLKRERVLFDDELKELYPGYNSIKLGMKYPAERRKTDGEISIYLIPHLGGTPLYISSLAHSADSDVSIRDKAQSLIDKQTGLLSMLHKHYERKNSIGN